MKIIVFIAPVALLVAYSQVMAKWRVEVIRPTLSGHDDVLTRLFVYLQDPLLVSCYLLSFLSSILWISVLERWQISHAFPIYTGLTWLTVMCCAVLLLGETISVMRLIGMLLIAVGVSLVGAS